MTRLWTCPATELAVDDSLQEDYQTLRGILAERAGVDDVVIHDRGGGWAPVVEDDNVLHVFLGAVPVTKAMLQGGRRTGPDMINGSLAMEGEWVPIRSLYACRSKELSNVYQEFSKMGGGPGILMQSVGNTWFLAMQPMADDPEGSDSTSTAQHCWTALLLSFCAVRFLGGSDAFEHWDRAHWRCMLDKLAQRNSGWKPLSEEIARLLENQVMDSAIDSVLPDPVQWIREQKARLEEAIEQNRLGLDSCRESLEEIREKHLLDIRGGGIDRIKDRIETEVQNIANLPQVRRIKPNGHTIEIYLAPMALPSGSRSGIRTVAAPVISMRPGAVSTDISLRGVSSNAHVHPHVRGNVCLGSIQREVLDLLQNYELFSAAQMMIGFLQTFNPDDPWGRAGTSWPAFNFDLGSYGMVYIGSEAEPGTSGKADDNTASS